MNNALWFVLGGATAYLLLNSGKIGFNLRASVGAGAGTTPGNYPKQGQSFRGAQNPQPYSPLGTVSGFPSQGFGYDAYIGLGGGGVAGSSGGFADQALSPQGGDQAYGTVNQPAESAGY